MKSRRALWTGQFLLSGLGLATAVWSLTDYLKSVLWGARNFGLYPWTYIFFHPVEGQPAQLYYYLRLYGLYSPAAFICFRILVFRGGWTAIWMARASSLAWGSLVLSAILLVSIWFLFSSKGRVIFSLGVAGLPLLWLAPRFAALVLPHAPLIRYGCPLICGILLLWAGSERLRLLPHAGFPHE